MLGSIPLPVKSNTLYPTARHRCDVSSELRCPGDKPWGRVPLLATTLRYYSKCNEDLIQFFFKFLCAALVTADTPHLKKLLLIKCFTVASLTKMQFKQNISEKLDFRYCCIASKFLEIKLESWTKQKKHDSNCGKLRTKKSRFVSKIKRFLFFAIVKGLGVGC